MRLAENFRELHQVADIVLCADLGLAKGRIGWHSKADQNSHDCETEMYSLLLHHNTFARLESRLKRFSEEITPLILQDDGQIAPEWRDSIPETMIAYGTTDAFYSPAVSEYMKTLLGAGHLAWFQSSAAGLEHPVLRMIGQKAELYTSCHEQSDAIAEWVIWAGLDFFQRGGERRRAQENKAWERISFREMSDTHWLVIGFGAIGQATARRLKALGAQVTGVRRSGGSSEHADQIVHPTEIIGMLPKADAVLLSLPHSPETENLADEAFFKAMQPGSLFLNVGRGALVDEEALLKALNAGRPAHAALDVLREEPQPESGPFWHHPNVTLTAHISAMTDQSKSRTDEVFLKNLAAFLASQTLENTVDKTEFV